MVSDQPSWGRRTGKLVSKARSYLIVSDQPSWGRRDHELLQRSTTDWFQTNPRGVGGSCTKTIRCARMFQTNPRGVGGNRSTSSHLTATRFRPTLVGSEVSHITKLDTVDQFQTNPRGVGGAIAEWTSSWNCWFQTNPRGVGGQLAGVGSGVSHGFRPTLVGSEVVFDADPLVDEVVSDQPSWGRRSAIRRALDDTMPVSDQPSWGRRDKSERESQRGGIVSDQPSWGRRRQTKTTEPPVH